jgi:AraC family transcriptional regulator, alkane utilization regulator
MDAVSDVLRIVRMDGAVYLHADFTAPFCVIGQTDSALCADYLPRSENVVAYHLIVSGHCDARIAGEPDTSIRVDAGELLVIPHGQLHMMGSDLNIPPVSTAPLLVDQIQAAPGGVMRLSYGGGGALTRVVCGFLACDELHSHPLLATLPRIFKIDTRNDPQSAWLHSSMQVAVDEAANMRPGSAIVLAKLSELLFVSAVRRHIDSLPADRKGWLAGVRDKFVGRALYLLHAQPAHDWTVDELAQKVGLSRSALAQRFSDLIGQPAMQYLASWRLQLAAQELATGAKSIVTIAGDVGYESEAAFSRAFKRHYGVPPAGWRKRRSAKQKAAA